MGFLRMNWKSFRVCSSCLIEIRFSNITRSSKATCVLQDGVLSVKEFQGIIRCLGLHVDLDETVKLASLVSADQTGFSVCFNEYLKFVGLERRRDPDSDTLINMFRFIIISSSLHEL